MYTFICFYYTKLYLYIFHVCIYTKMEKRGKKRRDPEERKNQRRFDPSANLPHKRPPTWLIPGRGSSWGSVEGGRSLSFSSFARPCRTYLHQSQPSPSAPESFLPTARHCPSTLRQCTHTPPARIIAQFLHDHHEGIANLMEWTSKVSTKEHAPWPRVATGRERKGK